jgi:hypothetical protein
MSQGVINRDLTKETQRNTQSTEKTRGDIQYLNNVERQSSLEASPVLNTSLTGYIQTQRELK